MTTWPLAILFDFDGVIVNSEPLHLHAFQRILEAEGISLSDEEYYRELIGFDDRGAFRHIFSQRGSPIDAKNLSRLMARKSEMVTELISGKQYQALPGVDQFVRELRRHYSLAICSGALRAEIETMLDGIGLRDCFATIIAAEDVTRGKPDPQGYLKCMAELSQKISAPLTPGDCLIVEDAPTVIKSVSAVGFQTLGVATSHAIEELSGATWKVKSLNPAEVAKQIPRLKIHL